MIVMASRMFQYRLYPSAVQEKRLFSAFDVCRDLHNQLLTESLLVYKAYGLSWTAKYTLTVRLQEIKDLESKYSGVHAQVLQNVCDRLSKAYSNFFRRVKEGAKEKGFPRFKSHVHSITYPQAPPKGGFEFMRDNRLHVSKIGSIPIVKHRDLVGSVKTLTVKRNRAGQWHAFFTCEVEERRAKHKSKESIGLDLGVKELVVFSDGTKVGNPRHLQESEKKLARLQHIFSRKAKGSNRRRTLGHKIAVLHQHITDQRSDFRHKLSHILTQKYKRIVIENLQVSNMVRNHCLAKHIHDAGWGILARYLRYKAVACGGVVLCVNPQRTSMTCNICGHIQDMPLSQRVFECEGCGHLEDRDVNASKNILERARLDEAEYTRREPASTSAITRKRAGLVKRELNAEVLDAN